MSETPKKGEALQEEIARLKERINALEESDSKLIELQDDLEEAEQLGVAVIECTPMPLVVVTRDGEFRRWNPPFETLTGYSTEELKSISSFEIFDDGQAFADLVKAAEREGRSEGTVDVHCKGLPRMTFDVNLERIHCQGDFCVVCVLFDALQKERYDKMKRAGAVARAKVAMLSRRQKQVFDLVVKGMPNKNIAAELGISEKTVEMHRSQVMRKLDVINLASLVRLAVLAELTDTESESSAIEDLL